jgi:hypothetical protein
VIAVDGIRKTGALLDGIAGMPAWTSVQSIAAKSVESTF